MAAMYAVYHGPEGLKTIAERVHGLAGVFALGLKKLGTVKVQDLPFFDTVKIETANAQAIADVARKSEINLRVVDGNIVSVTFIASNKLSLFSCLWIIELGAFQITVSFDETTTLEDVDNLFKVFSNGKHVSFVTHIQCS